jgi:hypothetical protein
MVECTDFCSEHLSRTLRSRISWAVLVPVLWTLTGCGDGGGTANRVPVSGLVTQGGQAVPSASLRLIPVDGNDGVASGGVVSRGQYQIAQESGPTSGKAYTVYIDELTISSAESRPRTAEAKPRQWQISIDVPDGGSDQLNLVIP